MSYGSGNITVNVLLQSIPSISAKFAQVLHLVDDAGGSTLGGDRYRPYYNYAQMAAEGAGVLAATVVTAGQKFFAQPGNNKVLVIGRVDTVGAESYADGLDAVILAGAEFWIVTADTRTNTIQNTIAAQVETLGRYMFIYQSSDGTWYTNTYPAAYTAMEGRERSALSFHDTDTEWSDLAVAGNRMDFDPDLQAVQFQDAIKEIAALATALTLAEEGELQDNQGNYGKSFPPATFWWGTGINHANRPIDHILAIDWWQVRLEERLATLVQQSAARGEKITVDAVGQGLVLEQIEAQIGDGLSAGHFLTESPTDSTVKTFAEPITITPADVTAQRLRFSVQLVLSTGVVVLTVNTYARAY